MEASNFDVDFSFIFQYNTSKLEASDPPLVFDYCASIAMFDGMIFKIMQHGCINDDA